MGKGEEKLEHWDKARKSSSNITSEKLFTFQ